MALNWWSHAVGERVFVAVAIVAIPGVRATGLALSGGFSLANIAEHSRANAGEDVLPEAVREMIGVARRRGIWDYTLSPNLASSNVFVQRMTEGAWPRRASAASRNLFLARNEPPPAACRVVETHVEIVYVACD